jgi:hypothetical protein
MAGKKKRAKGAKPKGSPGKPKGGKAPPAGKVGRAPQTRPKTQAPAEGKEKPAKESQTDLAPLKAKAEEAKKNLTRAENEATALRAQAKATEAAAKKAYVEAVGPYRDACRKAGVKCEFAGIKAPPVARRVRFLVETAKDGIKVAIKDKPDSEEVLPHKELGNSVWRAADEYCKRQFGETPIGAKARGLANRLRAALKPK